eukprot:scaffold138548_cov24-Tisochrysis_lutea.AAC.4
MGPCLCHRASEIAARTEGPEALAPWIALPPAPRVPKGKLVRQLSEAASLNLACCSRTTSGSDCLAIARCSGARSLAPIVSSVRGGNCIDSPTASSKALLGARGGIGDAIRVRRSAKDSSPTSATSAPWEDFLCGWGSSTIAPTT